MGDGVVAAEQQEVVDGLGGGPGLVPAQGDGLHRLLLHAGEVGGVELRLEQLLGEDGQRLVEVPGEGAHGGGGGVVAGPELDGRAEHLQPVAQRLDGRALGRLVEHPAGLELDQRVAGDAIEVGEGLARRRIGEGDDGEGAGQLAAAVVRLGLDGEAVAHHVLVEQRRLADAEHVHQHRRGAPRRGGSGGRWERRSASVAARRCPRARGSGRRRG